MNRQESTKEWYKNYHKNRGSNRNDLRTNRGVLFQRMALEASMIRSLGALSIEPSDTLILDVGCGNGGELYQFVRLGFRLENITGIDIITEQITAARTLHPNGTFVLGDASRMDFADASFDLLFESTMFVTLPDDVLAAGIAREMVRVCKPGGYLLLLDWRTPKLGDSNYKALTRKRLRTLFGVGRDTNLVAAYRGALVPPVGRFLSRYLPSAYFIIAAVFPFLVGQVAYVLQKSKRDPKS